MFYNSASTNPELPIEIQELARTPFSDAMDLIGAVLKLLGIFDSSGICVGSSSPDFGQREPVNKYGESPR